VVERWKLQLALPGLSRLGSQGDAWRVLLCFRSLLLLLSLRNKLVDVLRWNLVLVHDDAAVLTELGTENTVAISITPGNLLTAIRLPLDAELDIFRNKNRGRMS